MVAKSNQLLVLPSYQLDRPSCGWLVILYHKSQKKEFKKRKTHLNAAQLQAVGVSPRVCFLKDKVILL